MNACFRFQTKWKWYTNARTYLCIKDQSIQFSSDCFKWASIWPDLLMHQKLHF